MSYTNVKFELLGQEITPEDWNATQLTANFDEDDVVANIEAESFNFLNEAANLLLDYVNQGNIFKKPIFTITASNGIDPDISVNTRLDLTNDFEFINPVNCKAKVSDITPINDIKSRLSAVTFGLLVQNGTITPAHYVDVDYVVEKEFVAADLAILAITTYLFAKETFEVARTTANIIADALSGSLGSPLVVAAKLAAQAIYLGLMVVALVNLIKPIIEYIYPPRGVHKSMNFLTMLERTFNYLGYSFSSPINELQFYTYVPSKPEGSTRINEGIPNPNDYGYSCAEFVELCKQMFQASLFIDETNKSIQLIPKNNPFWRQQSSYIKPNVLNEQRVYNTDRAVSLRMVTFTTDTTDIYTVEDFKGTSYEIITRVNPVVPTEENALKGFEEIRFQVALGSRKSDTNLLERTLDTFFGFAQQILTLFNGNPNAFDRFRPPIGSLKVSSRYHSIPKVVYWDSGLIPANHRDLLSAKYLYDNYINYLSLVVNDFENQRLIYKGERCPMTLEGFVKAAANKYFVDSDGNECEFKSIRWEMGNDFALIDYEKRFLYTEQLEEIYIEHG